MIVLDPGDDLALDRQSPSTGKLLTTSQEMPEQFLVELPWLIRVDTGQC